MIKVGHHKKYKRNSKISIHYTYSDIKFKDDGWADVTEYLPLNFDLCDVKLDCGRIFSAWVFENKWEGLKLKPQHKVLFWRKHKGEEYAVSER